MDINIKIVDGGVLLPLKVLPGSRKASFRGVYDGCLKLSVTAIAEKGKANKAVIAFLAKELGVSKTDLSVQTGLTDSRKTVQIIGWNETQLVAKLIDLGIGSL